MQIKVTACVLILLTTIIIGYKFDTNFALTASSDSPDNVIEIGNEISYEAEDIIGVNSSLEMVMKNGWEYGSIEYLKNNYCSLVIEQYEDNILLYFDDINYTYSRLSQNDILEKYNLKTINGKLILDYDEFDSIIKSDVIYINLSVFSNYMQFINDKYSNEVILLQ